jgi:hypothetical protein
MQSVPANSGVGNTFSPNQLSSSEIQALLGFPSFRSIDRAAVIRAGAKIFRTDEKNIAGWRQLAGSDAQNVFVCLLAHLGEWVSGVTVAATPNGGLQRMVNTRLCELAGGKFEGAQRKQDQGGNLLPCLEDFGLSIACAMIAGPRGRWWSYYRICASDEVPHKGRKRIPFRPPITSRPAAASRSNIQEQPPEPQPESSEPEAIAGTQPSLFGFTLEPLEPWVDPDRAHERQGRC